MKLSSFEEIIRLQFNAYMMIKLRVLSVIAESNV